MEINYTVQQIVSFLTAAKCGNLSQAAGQLFVTQSSLSKTIKKLEDNLGVVLFNRGREGVTLTREGEYLYSCFLGGFTQFEKAILAARGMAAGDRPTLRVGTLLTEEYMRDYEVVRRTITRFARDNPGVNVITDYMSLKEMRTKLADGTLDIAFMLDSAMPELFSLRHIRLKQMSWELVMSARHPMARAEQPDMEALNNEVFFFLNSDETLIDPLMNRQRCLELGFCPKEEVIVDNTLSLLKQIKSGNGMFLSVGGMVSDENITVFPLKQLPQSPFLCAVWLGTNLSYPLNLMVSLLEEN